ncbi:hypothetical protein HDU76_006910, partial [Blyttiomyces sp. JEL0837]
MCSPLSEQPRSNSLWDTLPIEIKSLIISKCDPFTRYLNNDITDEELEQNGNEIWNIVFETDLVVFNLSLLPHDRIPKIDNGLALVRSKQMYIKLCQIRPDLLDTTSLERYLVGEDYWDYWKAGDFKRMNNTRSYVNLKHLCDRLFHIPLRHMWIEYFPTEVEATDKRYWAMDRSRLLIVACHFGHTEFVKHLVQDLHNDEGINECFNNVGLACLELAVNSGHAGIVEFLISSFKSCYTGDKCKSALKRACEEEYTEIISMLFTAFEPSDLVIEIHKIFRKICLRYKSFEIVRTLCNMDEVTSKLNGNWKIDCIANGVRNGGNGTIGFLVEKLEPCEWVGACEVALNVAVGGRVVRWRSWPFFHISRSARQVLELFEGVDVSA